MIYLTYFLGLFIIATIIYITLTVKWFIDLKIEPHYSPYTLPPMVIEKAYRARDFVASFKYTTRDQMMRNAYPRNPEEIVIMNDEHKKHIIDQFSRGLVKEMVDSKCVEIKEQDDLYQPDMKRVDLRVKVYQPE